jgi:hypothetical protein
MASVSVIPQAKVESPTFDASSLTPSLLTAFSSFQHHHHHFFTNPPTSIKQAFSTIMLTWSCHRIA